MTVKLLLSVLVFSGCIGAGMVKAAQYGLRLRTLEELVNALRVLEAKMTYSLGALPSLLLECSENPDFSAREFFAAVSENIAGGRKSFSECWNKALDGVYSEKMLSFCDLEVLRQIGKELGTTDLQGQKTAFSHVYQRLETQIEEARAEKRKKEKLYRGLGFYIGTLIPLVLL